MSDPLTELPYEIWARCIELAIHSQPAGPLAFLAVSQNWQRELLQTPALWTQICIQNDEDETARIWAFLHLSESSPLDVFVTTVLPTTDSLQLIKPHLSRVKTISIRSNTPHPPTALYAEQWRQAASNVMATFSDQLAPWNATDYSCSGRRIGVKPGVYHVATMQFSISYHETKLASGEEQSRENSVGLSEEQDIFGIWQTYLSRCALFIRSPRRSIVIEHHD
jgi:hypothetical protein